MPRKLSRLTSLSLGCLCVALLASQAVGQLRVVSYNTANSDGFKPGQVGLDTVLEAIGNEVVNGFATPIDVLALQEQTNSSLTTIVGDLNAIYGPGTYINAPINGQTTGAGRPGLIYNTNTVSLISLQHFGTVNGSNQARSTLRYGLRPVGYDSAADFYVYSNHYKAGTSASDQNRRNIEAIALRANLDALGQGTHAILAGDYNIQSSSESSYQTLLASGNGQAFDPINTPGTWNNSSSLRHTHTQSPVTTQIWPGQITGGMDDRFDFQLITDEFQDDEGLSYISGSYRAFGNNGTHFCCNSSILSGSGASPTVLTAIATASDHLPVVADYQLPAMMNATLSTVPTSVMMGETVNIDLMVENIASVLTSIGADELDYDVTVSGALSGSYSDTDFALGGGNTHLIGLDTSSSGLQSGTVTVTTSSQGAANSIFNLPVSFTVEDPPPPLNVIAKDDFDSTLNLNSFVQSPLPGTFASNFDGFESYQVGVSSSIPDALKDDSNNGVPSDNHGIVDTSSKTDAWFGITDLNNPNNVLGFGTASWEFDITGASDLVVAIDMAAMGAFANATDAFLWNYSIDGGTQLPLFTSSVDTGGSATYTLADGDQVNLSNPLEITTTDSQVVQLSNEFTEIRSPLAGTGDTLTISLLALTNDDTDAVARAYAFDNIVVGGSTSLTADFNDDGNVDHLDLAQWEGDFGLNDESDANGDGLSTGLDFLVWQLQNGQSSAPLATVQTVPEPQSVALILVCVIVNGVKRRRCRTA